MTTIIKLAVSLLAALTLTSCAFDINLGQVRGNGDVITETFTIEESFTGVKAAAGWNVYLERGSENKAVAEADSNIMEILDISVRGNTLVIKSEGNISRATSKKVTVTYTGDLDHLKASSGGQLITREIIKGEQLDLDVSSGGHLSTEAVVRNITMDASSGGHATIKGSTDDLNVDVSSGGFIKAKDLMANHVEASASSGGNADVYAKKSIRGRASSGGNIDYWGNPDDKDIPKKSYSGGSVRAQR